MGLRARRVRRESGTRGAPPRGREGQGVVGGPPLCMTLDGKLSAAAAQWSRSTLITVRPAPARVRARSPLRDAVG